MGLGIASIGGKDSMSGSFEQLDVPPTLVSFATAIGKASRVVSTEFKKPESTVVLLRPILDPATGCPNFFSLKANYKIVEQMMEEGMVAVRLLCGLRRSGRGPLQDGSGQPHRLQDDDQDDHPRYVQAHVRLHRAGDGL